jgi:hypothetical protein
MSNKNSFYRRRKSYSTGYSNYGIQTANQLTKPSQTPTKKPFFQKGGEDPLQSQGTYQLAYPSRGCYCGKRC